MKAQHTSLPELFKLAEDIVNSDPVISTYAAPEWDELHADGKVWIATIVRETLARSAQRELLEELILTRDLVEGERDCILEGHCTLNQDWTPRIETLDEVMKPHIARIDAQLARIDAAIAKATGK